MLWIAGLGTWAGIFWTLRRRAGPVTFVERQIAHVWAASMIGIVVLFFVEMILGMPVLTLSPVLALTSGMVFLVKAGMLSGQFYLQAAALFATALGMALLERAANPARHHTVRRRLGRLFLLPRAEVLSPARRVAAMTLIRPTAV